MSKDQDPKPSPEDSPEDLNLPSEDDPETLAALLENPEPAIEALLFAADGPLNLKTIRGILKGAKIDKSHLANLAKKLEDENRGFVLEEIAGGWQLLTRTEYHPWVRSLRKETRQQKLSQAALETLAIIAYKQPITRADIESIRGVTVGPVVRLLLDRQLIKIMGRAEVLGRPLIYGTTRKFLEVFKLPSINELPHEWPMGTQPEETPIVEEAPSAETLQALDAEPVLENS